MQAIYLDYDRLENKYSQILGYALAQADSFSLISYRPKFVFLKSSTCIHEKRLCELSAFLLRKIPRVKRWPGTETADNNRIMLIYSACEQILAPMLALGNIFAYDESLPEDIVFYKKDSAWLVTTTHERQAYMCSPTQSDLAFLRQHGIYFE